MRKSILMMSVLFLQMSEAQVLTLQDYKKQVFEKDPQSISLRLQMESFEKVRVQADFLTGVNVFVNTGWLDDQRPTVNPGFQGNQTLSETLSLGLQQQTAYGLKWSLSQNYQKTDIRNANPVAIPQSKFYDNFPKLELTVPLWRNWLGRETQSDQSQIRLQSEVQFKKAQIDWIQRQNEIEETYYNLLSKQETYQIQKDSLARAQKILQWSESRFNRNLIDEGDLFQAQAAVQSRDFSLLTAFKDLQSATRTFNALIGVVSDETNAQLQNDNINLTLFNLNKNESKKRLDLELRADQIEAQKRIYQAQKEKMKPSLDLQVQGWTQGRAATFSSAQKNTFEDEDYLFVGVGFSMPLDQFKASHVRSGYSDLIQSQQQLEQVRLRDLALNWQDTVEQASQIKQQLEILRRLEDLQRKKADSERAKLNQGRSTTFQVLNFEQDYLLTRNQRIQLEFQARQFLNSLALYQ